MSEVWPLVKQYHDKIVVIKYGGNAMINDELKKKVVEDIIYLKNAGVKPVIVHGGGPEITAMLKQVGKQSDFVSGLRVTDQETVAIAEMVLVGKINTEIVSFLNRAGAKSVGLNGKDADLIIAHKHLAEVHEGTGSRKVDIGYVGKVAKINTQILNLLIQNDYIPVIAPIGTGVDGQGYNINADYVAGEIAGALKAEILLLLTDIDGIYRDYKDKSTFINTLNLTEAKEMISIGSIDGGMIPKVEACVMALSGGTKKVQIIDGRLPHAILRALYTDEKIGTQVVNV